MTTISNPVSPYTSTGASTAAGQTNASSTSFQQLFAQITGVGQKNDSSQQDFVASITGTPSTQGAASQHLRHSSTTQQNVQTSQNATVTPPASDDGDDIASLISSLSPDSSSASGSSSTGVVAPTVDIFA